MAMGINLSCKVEMLRKISSLADELRQNSWPPIVFQGNTLKIEKIKQNHPGICESRSPDKQYNKK